MIPASSPTTHMVSTKAGQRQVIDPGHLSSAAVLAVGLADWFKAAGQILFCGRLLEAGKPRQQLFLRDVGRID